LACALACIGACVPGEAPCENAQPEVCGNGIDDDCDGEVDEPTAIDADDWFPDCDGDGYASASAEPITACLGPEQTAACQTWTKVRPSAAANTVDCNDRSAAYSPFSNYRGPGAAVSGNYDFNCDGKLDAAPYLVGTDGQQYRACDVLNDCDCYIPVRLSDEALTSVTADDVLPLPLDCGSLHLAAHSSQGLFGCEIDQAGDSVALTTVRQPCR
jgi:hypothetical protein